MQLRKAQEAAMNLLLQNSHSAVSMVTKAFEALGSHQRRRRILETVIWPVFDKPALPAEDGQGMPGFVYQFQVPVVVTLAKDQLNVTNVINPVGLDVDSIGQALVDSQAFGDVSMLACWPSLYRREDFYAYGPLQLAQMMVDLFRDGEADVIQPLPIILDPEIAHARTVTLHLWLGARVGAGSTSLLTREPLEPEIQASVRDTVKRFLQAQNIQVDDVMVLEPQHMVEGYFTGSPAWQCEVETTLRLACAEFDVGSVRLQLPSPGFFEILSADRSIVFPATMSVVPRQTLKEDFSRCIESQGLKLEGAVAPAIPVSGMMH